MKIEDQVAISYCRSIWTIAIKTVYMHVHVSLLVPVQSIVWKHPSVVVVFICTYKPYVINHWTATSSDQWSQNRPPSSLVCGQLLTMWSIVWRLPPNWHLSLVARPHFLWQEVELPWLVVYSWTVWSWQFESWMPDSEMSYYVLS